MIKLTGAVGAAMLCLGLLFTASNVAAVQDPMPKKEQKHETMTFSGKVSAITTSAITVIDNKNAEHTVAITGETKVTKDGKDVALADVKANDVVTVEAKKDSANSWTALKISLS